MKLKNWKHGLALCLALAIVLTVGLFNASSWLHAGEETQPPTVGAQEVQGNTDTVDLDVPETTEAKETEAPKKTEAPKEPEAPKDPETTKTQESSNNKEETEKVVGDGSEVIDPTQPKETVPETTAPGETVPETVPETTVPGETVPETTAPGETVPGETVPGETVPGETVPETTTETQPEDVLPAADLPLTVTQVDEAEAPLAEAPWTTTVHFDEGVTSVTVTLPDIEGYTTPELTVERTAETTELSAKAVYKLTAAETQPETEPTQPEETQPELTLDDVLPDDRSIQIDFTVPEDGIFFGDTIQLEAKLSGYDKVTYTLQWRWSTDDENWNEIEGETGKTLDVFVTPENYNYYWNVVVTVTGIKEEVIQAAAQEAANQAAETPAEETPAEEAPATEAPVTEAPAAQ